MRFISCGTIIFDLLPRTFVTHLHAMYIIVMFTHTHTLSTRTPHSYAFYRVREEIPTHAPHNELSRVYIGIIVLALAVFGVMVTPHMHPSSRWTSWQRVPCIAHAVCVRVLCPTHTETTSLQDGVDTPRSVVLTVHCHARAFTLVVILPGVGVSLRHRHCNDHLE
jgi:uncharacterized membrane protein